ncbi:hypothetical protein DFJ74DRAFT_679225 [Hyaloraphidium curvatum]|nr:hypothetical protein DFJ74DRAFT_679225 [Hyaloraphidium curvatum]
MRAGSRPVAAIAGAVLLLLFLVLRRGAPPPPDSVQLEVEDVAASRSQNLSPPLGDPGGAPAEDDDELPSRRNATGPPRARPARKRKGGPPSTDLCFNVEGYRGCGYFNAAVKLGEKAEAELGIQGTRRKSARDKDGRPFPPVRLLASAYHRGQWQERLVELKKEIDGAEDHRTSPIVYMGCGEAELKYVGGFEDFQRMMWLKYDV